MKVKICGITSLKEIEYLNKLKPDYMGLIFAQSKRKVDVEQAVTLVDKLDEKIKKVAFFRNNTYAEVKEVLKSVSVDIVQLHGEENTDFVSKLRKEFNVEIWRGTTLKSDISELTNGIDKLILDSSEPGSGVAFDWSNVKEVDFKGEIFLAGGVNLVNIDKALKVKGIDGIDISSGVEIFQNGIREKSYIKMKKVIKKVREDNEK